MKKVIATVVLLVVGASAHADWTLDPAASSLSFVSVKNSAVAEAHYFTGLSGTVSKAGVAILALDMAAFETLIPIRNERMVKWLFETAAFPQATFTADVPVDELKKMKRGSTEQRELTGTLSLHGESAEVSASVLVTRVRRNAFSIASRRPVIVNAAQFGLGGGVEKLREIAGLTSITPAIPVSFTLLYRR